LQEDDKLGAVSHEAGKANGRNQMTVDSEMTFPIIWNSRNRTTDSGQSSKAGGLSLWPFSWTDFNFKLKCSSLWFLFVHIVYKFQWIFDVYTKYKIF